MKIYRFALLLLPFGIGAEAPETPKLASAAEASETAPQFIARVNEESYARAREANAAAWVAATYINEDTQLLSAKASERMLAVQSDILAQTELYRDQRTDAQTARALHLLRTGNTVLPPKDPAQQAELATLAARLEAAYGAAKACADPAGPASCRDLGQLSEVLAKSRDPAVLARAWADWHDLARDSKADYERFAELLNNGARDYGFADTGALWRGGYDLPAAEFERTVDALYTQVEPIYEQLHCYARTRLNKAYGDEVAPRKGPIRADLLGNMWSQEWGNVWDILEPYPGTPSLDVSGKLAAAGWNAEKMTRQAEDFYVSLGMPSLPQSFWSRAQLTKPRDRDVVCHASAWDMDMRGDVRIKMCIEPNEEELRTIYHELGHVYYYLAYNDLPPLFQSGAHDGFHEAVGDTILLSLTPGYMHSIGLVDAPATSKEALINQQMKLAMDRIAFLPFGKLIDQWRWQVFSGAVPPEQYNQAWWDLKLKYQGVVPPVQRDAAHFDAGAKYHIPGNTPYTRYFLAFILQFQFHKALCETAGHQGPLHECSIYGNKAAGERFWAMLSKGQSQAWPATLKELTGGEKMDARPIIDYFQPLMGWLKTANRGQRCGW